MAKLHLWHRYIGVSISLLVIILSVSGILLNYSDTLKLNRIYASATWLLNRYHIGEFPVTSFRTQQHLVSQAGDYVYLDGHYVLNMTDALVGAIELPKDILLATQSSLLLINKQGRIIDELGRHSGLPESPLGIAVTQQGEPVLRGVNTYWKGSKALGAWQPLQGPHPKWVASTETPADINAQIQTHARSHEINIERVLLDLHSGRLLGSWGQTIMSIAAVLLLLLAVSGIVIWLRKKPNQ